jgi:protein-S-isoprenylcysteine O-methyltransferase Ste14
MYAGALVMLIGTPLALGSWWGLFAVLLILPVCSMRNGSCDRIFGATRNIKLR